MENLAPLENWSNTIKLVRKLGFKFAIEYGTDEIHPQEMPFSSISIPLAQNFESFDSSVDIFNDNTFFRQRAIEQLAFPCQRSLFAPLVRNATVFVQS